MTFSIAARCEQTSMFGIAIASSSPAVAARCAWVRADVGAACTQNVTDPRLGMALLNLMAAGATASEALATAVAAAEAIDFRQLTAIDAEGNTAAFSGANTLGTHATVEGKNAVAAGNLLRTAEVPAAMIAAFAAEPNDHLGDRLIAAMQGALAAGGEAGPVHSSGLLVVADVPWPIVDLRCDWADDPIGELSKLWRLWRPQIDDYVTRAINPLAAPGYGVPGDPSGASAAPGPDPEHPAP